MYEVVIHILAGIGIVRVVEMAAGLWLLRQEKARPPMTAEMLNAHLQAHLQAHREAALTEKYAEESLAHFEAHATFIRDKPERSN